VDPSITEEPWIDFSSGYVQRSIAKFPKQGSRTPWRLHQNYALDLLTLRYSPVEDGTMQFSRARQAAATLARVAS
jgi:monooxygenase